MKSSENKISENFKNKFNNNKNNLMKFNFIAQTNNENINIKNENLNDFEIKDYKQNNLNKKKYLSIKHNKCLSKIEIENKNNLKSRNKTYGLKEISYKVKQIIKKKGCTTYKEISDEIVNEINQKGANDKKNIRRRIYDSLNVMKSMKLFKKDKFTKKIMWNLDIENFNNKNNNFNDNNLIEYCNINNNSIEKNEIELKKMNDLINKLEFKINLKKQKFSALQNEMISLNKFIERNKKINDFIDENKKLYFPFIIIELNENNDNNNININMNENQNKIHFAVDSFKKIYADLDSISKINSNNLN